MSTTKRAKDRTPAMKAALARDCGLSASLNVSAATLERAMSDALDPGFRAFLGTGDWAPPPGSELHYWLEADGPPKTTNSLERERAMVKRPGLAKAWEIAKWPGWVPLLKLAKDLATTDEGVKAFENLENTVDANVETFAPQGGIVPIRVSDDLVDTNFQACWQLAAAVHFLWKRLFRAQHEKIKRREREEANERGIAAARAEAARAHGEVEHASASTGRGGQQVGSVEHPATAAQLAEHKAAAALGEAVQQAQQAQAARMPGAVLLERQVAFHATPLRDRRGVGPFLHMLDFCAYAKTAPDWELATLRADPATAVGFRLVALRFKAHSMGVCTTRQGYDLETPSTWEKSMSDPLHAGQHLWCKATHSSADELVAEVAASFRGTTEQWTERFAAIARLPADEDNEFVRYGPFQGGADERRYGTRIDLVNALPEPMRVEYQVRFAKGEFATHPFDPHRADIRRETYDQLNPTFSCSGEAPRRLKGHGEAPRKEHARKSGLARTLASCTPDSVNKTLYTLEVLADCESDGELARHVDWMNDALLPPTGHYSRDERNFIANTAGMGPAHYLETHTPPGQTLTWRQKGDLLQKYFDATCGNPQPLSDAQRRGRAFAMHAIWARAGGRNDKQQAGRYALRSDGRYDYVRLNALFAEHDLRHPAPAPPPPPGTAMPPPPNPAHAAGAGDESDDEEQNQPVSKRVKMRPAELNRILFSVSMTQGALRPEWMGPSD
jgi:hypothetical protein